MLALVLWDRSIAENEKWEIFLPLKWCRRKGKSVANIIGHFPQRNAVVEHLLLRFLLAKSIAVIINIIITKWTGRRRRHASFSPARCQRLLLHLELIYSLHAVNRKQFSVCQSNGTEEQKFNIFAQYQRMRPNSVRRRDSAWMLTTGR